MRAGSRAAALIVLSAALGLSSAGMAQGLRFQEADDDQPVAMTPEELAQLGDPLFRLVIRDHPETARLGDIEALIQPNPTRRQTFVVSERIHEPGGPTSARSVRAFTGQAADGTDVHGKVFLSTFFPPRAARFPETESVEAMAWDDGQGIYNYYKLDRSRGESGLTWRFRGSSQDADLRSDEDRARTCFACHINGVPLMKELLLPWNNWQGFTNPISGLSAPIDSLRWLIARRGSGDPRITEQLAGADQLELLIIPAIERFNRARLEDLKGAPAADGSVTISDPKRALRPVFETTEFNLISARETSGLHPFGANAPGQPGSPVCPPNSSYVNANVIAGMNGIVGLQVAEARQFQQAPGASSCAQNPLAVQPAEYRELLLRSEQSLAGVRPADVQFAWFTPEPSFVDNDMVDLLMSEGAITPQFAAAALAVDLETPIFSEARAALLQFLPESFAYQPLDGAEPLSADRHPDALTRAVIANLQASEPGLTGPGAAFLEMLQLDDPVGELRRRVADLRDRLIASVDPAANPPEARLTELMRLHGSVRQRYGTALEQQPFSNLVESPVLLPK